MFYGSAEIYRFVRYTLVKRERCQGITPTVKVEAFNQINSAGFCVEIKSINKYGEISRDARYIFPMWVTIGNRILCQNVYRAYQGLGQISLVKPGTD